MERRNRNSKGITPQEELIKKSKKEDKEKKKREI